MDNTFYHYFFLQKKGTTGREADKRNRKPAIFLEKIYQNDFLQIIASKKKEKKFLNNFCSIENKKIKTIKRSQLPTLYNFGVIWK